MVSNSTNNASENPRAEMLSALLDGESSDFETRRILQTFSDEDRSKWRSYSLIQQSMQASAGESLDLSIDVSEGVRSHIDAQESDIVKADEKRSVFALVKPLASFAAASLFAFVTVVSLEGSNSSDTELTPGFVASGNVHVSQFAEPSQSGVMPVNATISQVDLASESTEAKEARQERLRLEYYIQRHAQQRAVNNGQGFMPLDKKQKEQF